ncbi:IS4 family transposase, partial [Caldibacillus thermoamylovorans]|nr:IS4 family transposase [Caldibacillus thermoamylovorans]
MINKNSQFNQLPKELDSVFSELEVNKHLRQAGIKKSFGFSCSYLFQLIFCLIFQHRNWFSLLDSK